MRKTAAFLTSALTLVLLSACNAGTVPPTDSPSSSSSSSSTPTMPTASSEASSWTWDGIMQNGKHQAIIETSKGSITVELDADTAPKTVTNFMALASSGYYSKTTFHRVIPGFMIQGGDPNGNGTGGQSIFGETFEDEINPTSAMYKTGYKKGAIAMANRGPNTNGSQFFIMDADYPLPPSYTIFGKVTAGQDVVNAIANVERGANDMPTEPVTFNVKVVK
ncbi:MAG: peptidylprolyl isomerase [Candidatus Peribacteraceae bacterium]|nr:peptidylprolyl isomerase [Candidatus Peribacteraceae bacterium]